MAADLANQLEGALKTGDFGRAQPLLAAYARAVRTELFSATHAGEREEILRNALETLNAHLYLARAMRSHISARLKALAGESLYRAPSRKTYTWRIEA